MLALYFVLKCKWVSNILYANTPCILRANSLMKIYSVSYSNSGNRGCFLDLFSKSRDFEVHTNNSFKRIFLSCINHGNWFRRLRPRIVLNKSTVRRYQLFSTLPERESSSDFELIHTREEILSSVWYHLLRVLKILHKNVTWGQNWGCRRLASKPYYWLAHFSPSGF